MSSLTQLSQAIHDAPRWHQPEYFQHTDEIQIVAQKDQALGAVVTGRYLQSSGRSSADIPVLGYDLETGVPPDVVPVSNAVGQGDYTGHGELAPHADHQWTPLPSFGSLLYAIELPQDGGKTSWFNTIAAYDALDKATQAHVDQLQLITYNPFVRAQSNKGSGNYSNSPLYRFKDQPILGHAYPHPLVRTHPETGRKALWLNSKSEVELVNYDDQAGAKLIAELRQHLEKPEFRYQHQWETGDIVFWDNQVTLHAREPFPADQRRLLKRISLAGSRPF